jgi:HNH endonuclease
VHGKEPTGFGNTKVWPMYNRWLWEQHKGPIPPKHMVIFKDGDRSHCEIGNLELLSTATPGTCLTYCLSHFWYDTNGTPYMQMCYTSNNYCDGTPYYACACWDS